MTPFIVAEVGGNHLGQRSRALALIDAAWKAGADAVKFQCFTPEQMADPGVIVQSGPWAGRELLDLYRETHTPREWFPQLFESVRKRGIIPFASVFHPDDVDFLETLGCEMYKISSFEITDLDLIRYAAASGKKIVVSAGMANWSEIHRAAVVAPREFGKPYRMTFLKCTSAYPASIKDTNLKTISDMIEGGLDVGISDHTLGLSVAVAATALGASMVEKHMTLRRSDGGPDAAFSSEPEEFAAMVKACRETAEALGEVRYGPTESELSSLQFRRRPGSKRGG